MSEKLANRLISVINAELLALLSIPPGGDDDGARVGLNDLPWPVGAAPVALALGGLGFKYIKEALDWTEDDEVPRSAE